MNTVDIKAKLAAVLTLTISKKVGSKREEVGKVAVPVPTLADIGYDVEPKEFTEDGRAVYEADVYNGIYNAVLQYTTKKARNSLQAGSTDFKDGYTGFAATLEDLFAPAAVGGSPEAALAITAFKNSFKTYLAGLGLAAKAQAFLSNQVASPKSLIHQPDNIRGKVEERLGGWVDWAEENAADIVGSTYVENYLTKLLDACQSEDELDLDAL